MFYAFQDDSNTMLDFEKYIYEDAYLYRPR